MNIGIVTSYVIGGFMLVSVLIFNMSLNTSSQETTLSTINQEKRDNLGQILTCDFNGLGYSNGSFNNSPIYKSTPHKLEFRTSPACVDNGNFDAGEVITLYTNPNKKDTDTTNPNDFYLYREDKNGTTKYLVSFFEITYYKKNEITNEWNEISNPTSLPTQRNLKIQVEILFESEEPIKSSDHGVKVYHRTAWKRSFIPSVMNNPWY